MTTETFETFVTSVIDRFGGKVRENQMEMMRHVMSATQSNEPLIIEAPVGSGKSMAYSLPAILAAKSQGKRTLIVTRTKKLQDQLAKDFPKYLEAILGEQAHTIKWTTLKGRNHFTCKKRITSNLDALPYSLANWATGEGGSRNDAPPHLDKEWWSVSGGQDCIGKKCPFYDECPGTRQRVAAKEASIVIANQTLLAMQVVLGIEAIPGMFDIVIVDEAQHFENTVREQLANDLTPSDLQRATFADAADLLQTMLPKYGFEFHSGIEPGQELWRVYGNSIRQMKALRDEIEENDNPDLEDKKMLNLLVKVVKCLNAFSKPEENVLWLDAEGMHSSPIDVKYLIKDAFSTTSAIFTSATIPDDLGLEKEIVKISGGYTNAGLYVANYDGSGKYSFRPDAAKETLDLIQALGGRSLLLYTSEAAMNDMYDYLRVRLNVPVYHQKLPDAIDKFRREETSVLCGIETCWEGIDIKGPSLALVVIDRLPFPNAGDPIYQAEVQRRGWYKASMPATLTMFRQGAGRLLRGPDDIGVIALLDNRVINKGYGPSILNSIKAQRIPDKETAISFLKQMREEFEESA